MAYYASVTNFAHLFLSSTTLLKYIFPKKKIQNHFVTHKISNLSTFA